MASPSADVRAPEPVRARWIVLIAAQLAALSFYPALDLWRTNLVAGVGGGPLVLIGVISTMVSWLLLLAWWRARGLQRLWKIGAAVSALMFAFYAWSGFPFDLSRDVGPPHGVGALAFAAFLSVTLIVAAYRFGTSLFVRTAFAAVAAALIVPSTIGLISVRHGSVAPPAARGPSFAHSPATARRDVFIVVLDGYGRADRLSRYLGFDNSAIASALSARGIDTVTGARANYSLTYAAVPSALTMEYLFTDDRPIRSNEIRWINRISGGDNRVVRSLKAAGYRYIHIESGLAGSACGPLVDECYQAPFLDETTGSLFSKTPAAHLLRSRVGHAFTLDALDALEELIGVAGRPSGTPRLVFAHILLPHPPLFVAPDCSIRIREGMDGLAIAHPRYMQFLSKRIDAYRDQVQCVNRRLVALADAMPRDGIVAFLGDHGAESQGQFITPVSAWTDDQVRERMASFMAYRLHPGCRGPGRISTPINLMRFVVACAIDADIPALPDRSFLVPAAPAAGEVPPPIDVSDRVG